MNNFFMLCFGLISFFMSWIFCFLVFPLIVCVGSFHFVVQFISFAFVSLFCTLCFLCCSFMASLLSDCLFLVFCIFDVFAVGVFEVVKLLLSVQFTCFELLSDDCVLYLFFPAGKFFFCVQLLSVFVVFKSLFKFLFGCIILNFVILIGINS